MAYIVSLREEAVKAYNVSMAHRKLLSAVDILNVAIQIVEQGRAEGLSLRAVALALEVKAPSLYRYFPDKAGLELAVAEETLRRMRGRLEPASAFSDRRAVLREMANAYVRFARENYALYSFVFHGRAQAAYGSEEGKAVWRTLLEAVGGVSGKPDDTAFAVAIWSFLHGYVTLEHAGGFGTSGPQGGLDWGLNSLMNH